MREEHQEKSTDFDGESKDTIDGIGRKRTKDKALTRLQNEKTLQTEQCQW